MGHGVSVFGPDDKAGTRNHSRRVAMAYFERVRDVVSGPYSPDVIQQRTASGWQMVSIEWRRELPDSERPPEGGFNEDIPYRKRVSDLGRLLAPEARQDQALM